ncbi:MAG: hypothetical protein WD468_12120 [Pirellulales bacterium]
MLISPLAILVMSVSAAVGRSLADAPIVLEGPSTLELGLIGAGVILVYAVATRTIGRRRERISKASVANQSDSAALQLAKMEEMTEQKPSRGAA